MYRRTPRADAQRIGQVLAGIEFPAAKWQLIMHAEEYGADSTTRSDLWSLPARSYADLVAVLAALGLVAPPTAIRLGRAHRSPQPTGQQQIPAR